MDLINVIGNRGILHSQEFQSINTEVKCRLVSFRFKLTFWICELGAMAKVGETRQRIIVQTMQGTEWGDIFQPFNWLILFIDCFL